jgi:glucuronate isomerase
MKVIAELREHVFALPLIDTHEHLPSREEVRDRDTDVLKEYLAHYYNRDLISAGLAMRDYTTIVESRLPIREKWKMVEPYWEVSRHTGYGRCLDIAVRELYGIDGITSATIEPLNERFLKTLEPGHFRWVLKERCGIERSLLCVETLEEDYDPLIERSIHCDRELFVPVYIINTLVHPESWGDIERVERESGLRVTSFSSWLEAAEANVAKARSIGFPILKNSLAYVRGLHYGRVTRAEAENAFNEVFRTRHFPEWHQRPIVTAAAFQDYMFHFVLEIANREKLVMQIHTGIQEGSGNLIPTWTSICSTSVIPTRTSWESWPRTSPTCTSTCAGPTSSRRTPRFRPWWSGSTRSRSTRSRPSEGTTCSWMGSSATSTWPGKMWPGLSPSR